MGTDVFVVYYGVRYVVSDDEELTLLEHLSHPLIHAATSVGLEHLWGPVPDDEEHYYLLVGTELGSFGWEESFSLTLAEGDLMMIIEDTKDKLRQAAIADAPSLQIQLEPKV